MSLISLNPKDEFLKEHWGRKRMFISGVYDIDPESFDQPIINRGVYIDFVDGDQCQCTWFITENIVEGVAFSIPYDNEYYMYHLCRYNEDNCFLDFLAKKYQSIVVGRHIFILSHVKIYFLEEIIDDYSIYENVGENLGGEIKRIDFQMNEH
jgi:hypothetical protein